MLVCVIRVHAHTNTHARVHTLTGSCRHGPLMQCDCSPLGLLSAPLPGLCCMRGGHKPRRGIPQSLGLASSLFAHFFKLFFFFRFLPPPPHTFLYVSRIKPRFTLAAITRSPKRAPCRIRPWQIKCDTASRSNIIDGL